MRPVSAAEFERQLEVYRWVPLLATVPLDSGKEPARRVLYAAAPIFGADGSVTGLVYQAMPLPAGIARRMVEAALRRRTEFDSLEQAIARATRLDPNYVQALGQVDNAEWGRRAALGQHRPGSRPGDDDARDRVQRHPQRRDRGRLDQRHRDERPGDGRRR